MYYTAVVANEGDQCIIIVVETFDERYKFHVASRERKMLKVGNVILQLVMCTDIHSIICPLYVLTSISLQLQEYLCIEELHLPPGSV